MFWWNQLPCGPVLTPISCTKLKIHSAHASGQIVPKQVFFPLPAIWKRDQFMLHRSRNSGRGFWWNQLPCGPVLTPMYCTKLKIHSAHASGQIVPKQVFFLGRQFGRETSLCFTDQETQEEMFWWNQLPCGPVLTPISCTKLKIHSAHASGQIVPKQVFFSLLAIWKRDQFMLHRSRNSGRDFFGGTSSLVGQFLQQSPVQSSRSIQLMQAVKLFLNKSFFFQSCAGNLDEGPSVYASQIKKLRKRFLVEPTPLWASSYTHLLYKAQDPSSPHRQSNCS